VQHNRKILRRTILVSLAILATACGVGSRISRATLSAAAPKSEHQVGFPAELYARSIPADNPQTPAKVALGQALFVDPRLSADKVQRCESCHDYTRGFTDQRKTSVGVDNQLGQRNAPTILNAMFNTTLFWDGRASSLEEQAKSPILNPLEMGMTSSDEVVARLRAIPAYEERFRRAFGREVNFDDIARALASYERTQFSFDSPFDHFIAGDSGAIDGSAKRGWLLFTGKARCVSCHAFSREHPLFTDDRFHNTGVSWRASIATQAGAMVTARDQHQIARFEQQIDRLAVGTSASELGRFVVTGSKSDIAAFRTPDLRNLLVTEPYFHDGSAPTLWDVVAHFNRGGVRNPFLDAAIVPLDLSKTDEDDLVAFLATLTSPEYEDAAKMEYQKQFKASRNVLVAAPAEAMR
jgi:cytochrome c peroxidase